MKYKVYLIEHTENNKKYVGWTSQSLEKRFYQHSMSNRQIGRAIKKYGKDKFTIRELESFDTRDEVLLAEMRWIAQHKSNDKTMGYNSSKGGEDSPIHRNHDIYKTEDYIQRMSKQATNQHNDPEKKKKHIIGIRGYWQNISSEEKEIRRSIARENGKLSKGWNKGLSCPTQGTRGEAHHNAKTYLVTRPDGTTEIIKSLKTYCEANGLTYRNAQGVLEGKQAHHKQYKFTKIGELA